MKKRKESKSTGNESWKLLASEDSLYNLYKSFVGIVWLCSYSWQVIILTTFEYMFLCVYNVYTMYTCIDKCIPLCFTNQIFFLLVTNTNVFVLLAHSTLEKQNGTDPLTQIHPCNLHALWHNSVSINSHSLASSNQSLNSSLDNLLALNLVVRNLFCHS